MAAYTVAAGEHAAHAKTLVANTVDTVTFVDRQITAVEIVSDGVAAIYVRTDGVDPTVAGAFSDLLPAGVTSSLVISTGVNAAPVVKLISSGTPRYSVIRV